MHFTKLKRITQIIISFLIILIPCHLFAAGTSAFPSLGSVLYNKEITAAQIKFDIRNIVSGSVFISVGLIILVTFVFKKRKLIIALPLSFFSFFIGIYLISMTGLAKFFIVTSPVFWHYITFSTGYLVPVLFFMSVRFMFENRERKIVKLISMFFLLYFILTFSLDLLSILPLWKTINIFLVLLTIAVIVLGVLIFITVHNSNSYYKILLFSFIALLAAGIYDVTAWFLGIKLWGLNLSSIGALIFLLTLLSILEKSFFETEKKLESYTNEIRQMDATIVEHQKLLQQTLENDKLKSEFFSNISHELRTPLNILLSNIQLMNHYIRLGEIKSETRDINKYMVIMRQNCFRLLKLINNIIDITKIDSGYMQPIMKNYDIVEEVENIVLSISEYAENKGLALHFYSNTESFITACDPEKMERILLNLLSNAVKFTKRGGSINVNINCSESQIRITVSDTGIGIPEDKLSSIFERFNQVDRSFTKSYEGSGIGLSLVHSLIEMHGGTISVHSEVSKGSEFTISLPVKLVEENEKNIRAADMTKNGSTENINIEFSDIPK